jgi:hypothetical protein
MLPALLGLAAGAGAQRKATSGDAERAFIADSLKKVYIAQGVAEDAAARRAQTVAESRTGVELRASTYNMTLPLAGSIWVDRDSVTGTPSASHAHNFTPEQFVKDIFVKGGGEIADQAIRNVTLISSTWNGSPATTWNDKGHWGPFGGNAGTWSNNDRELLYFDHGDTTTMVESWDGTPNAVKRFGIEKGFLLSTGPGLLTEGINASGGSLGGGYTNWTTLGGGTAPANDRRDPDLSPIAAAGGLNLETFTSLEFDFRSYTDSVSFQFIFASEEFNMYSNSPFNDAFGFFVSGPGLTDEWGNSGDTINIARYPDGAPIAVNSSNWGNRGGSNTLANFHSPTEVSETKYTPPYGPGGGTDNSRNAIRPQYHQPVYNNDGLMEYQGHSVVLTAKAGLQKGVWYHMKLAIGNVTDGNLGSGVFLMAGSLDLGAPESTVPSPYMTTPYDSIYGASSLYAGCENSLILKFDPMATDRDVEVWSAGSGAAYAYDYDLNSLFKDTVLYTIGANDTVLHIPFKVADDVPDGSRLLFYSHIVSSLEKDTSDVFTLYAKSVSALTHFAAPSVGYAGALEVSIQKGSPYIQRSLNGGLSWEFARDTITGAERPFTRSQIAHLTDDEGGFILFREPNTCCVFDTVYIKLLVISPPSIIRTVVIPDIPGVITRPSSGEYRVESRSDYEFTVIPGAGQADMELKVTTSRTDVPPNEDVTITRNTVTGAYTVVIHHVQEMVYIFIEFNVPEGTAAVDADRVSAHDGMLSVRSGTAGEASVYAISGVRLSTFRLGAGETVTQPLPPGFYLVSLNGRTHKVAIR